MQKNKKLIIGNWKMNPATQKEAQKLYSEVLKNSSKIKKTEVVICPPVLYIPTLRSISKKISLGGQNVFFESKGAFTGEISAPMLAQSGAMYVIIGHSERRAMGENDQDINKKVKASISAGLKPIICVGEKERGEGHGYLNIIKSQLEETLQGVSKSSLHELVIAYEPVWALSSTIPRHDFVPSEFLEIKIFIKKILSDLFGQKTELPRIIYGGSARPDNALLFLTEGNADGLLPGRDSLDAKKFLKIIGIAETL